MIIVNYNIINIIIIYFRSKVMAFYKHSQPVLLSQDSDSGLR